MRFQIIRQFKKLLNMDLKNISYYVFVVLSVLLGYCIEVGFTKVSYKRPIQLKEKFPNKFRKDVQKGSTVTTGLKEIHSTSTTPSNKDSSSSDTALLTTESTSKEDATTAANVFKSRDDLSCTCGIFLSSQFVKGSPDPPKGEPVISSTLERNFVCNPVGQKQCQTKCLEQIVQHLPNSARILCASLDHDIRKERAYLFVRNCNSKWHNTNLAAGREYCCKNGLPYNCSNKKIP